MRLDSGSGGNLGAYAVQLAQRAGLRIFATASAENLSFAKCMGADTVIDSRANRFEDVFPKVEVAL